MFWIKFLQYLTTAKHITRECKKNNLVQQQLQAWQASLNVQVLSNRSVLYKIWKNLLMIKLQRASFPGQTEQQSDTGTMFPWLCVLFWLVGWFLRMSELLLGIRWLMLRPVLEMPHIVLWIFKSSQDVWDSSVVISLHRYILEFGSSTCDDDGSGTFL